MAGKRATTYSANAITFNFALVAIESGRGPDSFLEIVQQGDDFGYSAGLDGEGVFWEDLNKYTLVTLTLMQTAAGNGLLYAIHAASKLAGGLLSPLYIEDRKGTSKLISTSAIIMKTPDETFAKEPGTTVWVLGVHDPDRILGGH